MQAPPSWKFSYVNKTVWLTINIIISFPRTDQIKLCNKQYGQCIIHKSFIIKNLGNIINGIDIKFNALVISATNRLRYLSCTYRKAIKLNAIPILMQ